MSVRGQIDKILATFEEETRNEIHRLRQENDTLRRKLNIYELRLVPETELKLRHVIFCTDNGEGSNIETTIGIYTSLLQAYQGIDRYIERMQPENAHISSKDFSIETLSDLQKKDGDQLFVVEKYQNFYGEDDGGPVDVYDSLEKAEKVVAELRHKASEEDPGNSVYVRITTVIVGRDEALM